MVNPKLNVWLSLKVTVKRQVVVNYKSRCFRKNRSSEWETIAKKKNNKNYCEKKGGGEKRFTLFCAEIEKLGIFEHFD